MKSVWTGATCTAAVLALGMAVFAQTTGQTPAQPPSPTGSQPAAQTPARPDQPAITTEQPITVAGCVQRETDYRRVYNIGRGGVAGTGVGAGDEFVLVNASTSTAAATPGGTPPTPAPEVAGTTGTAAPTAAYEVTGPAEERLEKHVGKRVEIVGKLKGGTPGASRQIDPMGRDLNLPELEITSVRELAGTCPPMQK